MLHVPSTLSKWSSPTFQIVSMLVGWNLTNRTGIYGPVSSLLQVTFTLQISIHYHSSSACSSQVQSQLVSPVWVGLIYPADSLHFRCCCHWWNVCLGSKDCWMELTFIGSLTHVVVHDDKAYTYLYQLIIPIDCYQIHRLISAYAHWHPKTAMPLW